MARQAPIHPVMGSRIMPIDFFVLTDHSLEFTFYQVPAGSCSTEVLHFFCSRISIAFCMQAPDPAHPKQIQTQIQEPPSAHSRRKQSSSHFTYRLSSSSLGGADATNATAHSRFRKPTPGILYCTH